ncbi:MAG TPA: hypothetical protein VGO08_22895 [Burkholderiales bacterium]|nr:hypothetical protein [Burkholderiales bacterium]
MNNISESSRSDVASASSGDDAARAWFVASVIAAVVVLITFTAVWIQELIAPVGALRLFV